MNGDLKSNDQDQAFAIKELIKYLTAKITGNVEKKTVPEIENMSESDKELLQAKRKVYDEIADQFPLALGKEIAKEERVRHKWGTLSFTYGEIVSLK